MSNTESSIPLGTKLAKIINKIRKENNITYRQMCMVLKSNDMKYRKLILDD